MIWIRFQPLSGEMGAPTGRLRNFRELTFLGLIDLPRTKPSQLKRAWKIAVIGTNEGALEVATGKAGLTLLAGQSGSNTGPS